MLSTTLITLVLLFGYESLATSISARIDLEERRSYSYHSFNPGFDVTNVVNVGKQIANHSWEYGTLAEALLEVYNLLDAVYSTSAFPHNQIPKVSAKIPSLEYAGSKFNFSEGNLSPGDGANGDPAALGVSAVLIGETNATVKAAAKKQIADLFTAPRFYNGAISQRVSVAELWSDGAHMFPPFLAYYGVATKNASMIQDAAQQLLLYRDVLIANTTQSWKGLWTHIVGPQSQTLGIWCTGNGWAALGMARVLATMKNLAPINRRYPQQALLVDAMMAIFDGLKGVDRDNTTGLLRNYLVGGSNSQHLRNETWFGDASGSAALVAAALRLAVLEPSQCKSLYTASRNIRDAVVRSVSPNGLVMPTVNPLDWFSTEAYTKGSPEAQAFVLNMYSAWRDCVHCGCCPHPSKEKRSTSKGKGTWGGDTYEATHTTL